MSYDKRTGGEIGLAFADGTSAVCDLLVGCDGIKSVVRTEMLRAKAVKDAQSTASLQGPRWTGSIAYRGLIPSTDLPSANGTRHSTLRNPMMVCTIVIDTVCSKFLTRSSIAGRTR